MNGQAGAAGTGWEGPQEWADLSSHDTSRSVVCANLNGVTGKLVDVSAFLKTARPMALAVVETRLATGKAVGVGVPGYSFLSKERATGTGGGVGLFVRNDLKATRVRLRRGPVEALAVKVILPKGGGSFVTLVVYRPPDTSRARGNAWEDGLGAVLAQLGEMRERVVLLGDLNLGRGEAEAGRVEALLADAGLVLLDTPATHGPLDGGRRIDWAAVGPQLRRGVYGTGLGFEKRVTGHRLVFLVPKLRRIPQPHPVYVWRTVPDWRQADVPGFLARLESPEVAGAVTTVAQTSPSIAVDLLAFAVTRGVEEFIPTRRVRTKTFDPAPWLTPATERVLDEKHAARRGFAEQLRRHGRQSEEAMRAGQRVRQLHKDGRRRVRKDKALWVVRLFAEARTPEQLWKVVKLLQSGGREASSCLPSPAALAAHFARVYRDASVFHKDVGLGPAGEADAEVGVVVPRIAYSRDLLLQLRPPRQPAPPPPPPPPVAGACEPQWVDSAFSALRHSISAGPDGISARLAFLLRPALLQPVADVINGCVRTGEWPRGWKRARICAVPKEPGTDDPCKYRPIAVLPFLSKLAEQFLVEHLRDCYVPHPAQFGFVERSGVGDAQADLQMGLAQLFSTADRPRGAVLLSLDVSKAFDSVSFDVLDQRLSAEGVQPAISHLLSDYVRGRSAFVRTSEGSSVEMQCCTGVPQGSRLGPALFSLYLNSAFSVPLAACTSLRAYADDLCILAPWGTPELECRLQMDVNRLVDHLHCSLGLRLNAAKSSSLLVHFVTGLDDGDAQVRLRVGEDPVAQVRLLRYLGTHWDGRLSLDDHWHGVHGKAKHLTYALHGSFGRLLQPRVFRGIWKSRVEPVVSWGFASTGPKLRHSVVEIERIGKHAAHLVARTDFRLPYASALKELGTPPFWLRLLVLEMGFVYASYMGLRRCSWAQSPVPDARVLRRSQRLEARARQPHPLQVYCPPTPLVSIETLPLIRGIRCWNALQLEPEEVEFLSTGEPDCLRWWRRFGHRAVERSVPELKALFPHFPFDAHEAL